MNEPYNTYLIEKWKEAEAIGSKIGAVDNHTVATIFNKLAQPYYYWNKKD